MIQVAIIIIIKMNFLPTLRPKKKKKVGWEESTLNTWKNLLAEAKRSRQKRLAR